MVPVKSGSGKLHWALPERCFFCCWLLKVHQFCILPIQAELRWIGLKGSSVVFWGGNWLLYTSCLSQWNRRQLDAPMTEVKAFIIGDVRAKCQTELYHSNNSHQKTGGTIISMRKCHWGTVCVTCHLCISLFALSPFSLATTSLSGKPLRSKIDLKVKHWRFPKGRGKINYDRWLCGLVVFLGAGGQIR